MTYKVHGGENYLGFPILSFVICKNVETREDDFMLCNRRLYTIITIMIRMCLNIICNMEVKNKTIISGWWLDWSFFQQLNLCGLKCSFSFNISFFKHFFPLMWVVFSKVTRSFKTKGKIRVALLQAICSWCHLNLNHKDFSKRKHFHLLIYNPGDKKSWHPRGNTFQLCQLGNLHLLFKWTKKRVWIWHSKNLASLNSLPSTFHEWNILALQTTIKGY